MVGDDGFVQRILHPDGGRALVVLHPHHDLLLHRQPGRLSHRREDGVTHW
jgi:hypothetical protein